MIFLTEDDIRQRCSEPGGSISLGRQERLTPSASEYVSGLRIKIAHAGEAAPDVPSDIPAQRVQNACRGTTWLNATTQVAKTHARIVFRGKLDSLLASAVLTQTQFDPKDRLPVLLKDCLHDVKNWIMQVLAAEVSENNLEIGGMAGIDMDTLHEISRDPAKFLGMDHSMADASQGGNVALINWLRALTRETEIEALRALPPDSAICCALNRLSSALYVLMLLTMAAQKGKDLSQFRG